ncbi:MAG: endonuclease domain-containing protein [Hyphomonas sp.]
MTGLPIKRARRLRREGTLPERLLWSKLRGGQLAGLKFRRQHPVGPFIADFACFELKLLVELDGHTHGTDSQIRRDASRTAYLSREGWHVVRFWNVDVMDSLDGVLQQIEDAARFIQNQRGLGPHG